MQVVQSKRKNWESNTSN